MRGLATLVLAAVLSPLAAAQLCFGPDGLNGPCCAPVAATLPQFPQVQMSGLGICWTNCQPQQVGVRILWGIPQAGTCGEFKAPISVFHSATGVQLFAGTLILDYTRTWGEVDPAGNQRQVWRFAAKADLQGVATGAIATCPVPNCIAPAGPHPTAFYYGYVDYSRACNALAFQPSAVLYHNCDAYIHRPGLSDRPGVFHPNRSFALVGPNTPVQPFVPMILPGPGGAMFAEAFRDLVHPFVPGSCVAEDPIQTGQISPFAQGCLCNGAVVPAQNTLRKVGGQATCTDAAGNVTNFFSQPPVAGFPWNHMVTTSIGCWQNPNVWPGNECAWVDEGFFRTFDACLSSGYDEVYYGGSTQGGFTVLFPTTTQPAFLDIADNYTVPAGGPFVFPLFGSIQPTDHLIYVNTP